MWRFFCAFLYSLAMLPLAVVCILLTALAGALTAGLVRAVFPAIGINFLGGMALVFLGWAISRGVMMLIRRQKRSRRRFKAEERAL